MKCLLRFSQFRFFIFDTFFSFPLPTTAVSHLPGYVCIILQLQKPPINSVSLRNTVRGEEEGGGTPAV